MDLDLITKGKILSSNELNILTYLVSNIDNLDNLSLKEISKQAFTSPAKTPLFMKCSYKYNNIILFINQQKGV